MSLRTITEFAPWPPARRALKRLIYWPGAPNHRKLRWNRERRMCALFWAIQAAYHPDTWVRPFRPSQERP